MDERVSQEIDKLKIIYYDIINGYSYDYNLNIYIKHFSDLETGEIINQKANLISQFVKEGVPTFKERFDEITKNGEWTAKDEDDLLSFKYQVSDNEKHVQTIIPIQRPAIELIIKETKNKLNAKLRERKFLIGVTAEDLAETRCENYFLYNILYKDKDLIIKFFDSYEDMQSLDNSELKKYFTLINEKMMEITEQNIYKIAAMPFFLNIFSYSKDNIYTFLKKPISKLTTYQVLLLNLGQRNLAVLNDNEGKEPPSLIDVSDLQEIIKFYDEGFSILKGKSSTKQVGITRSSKEVVTTRHY